MISEILWLSLLMIYITALLWYWLYFDMLRQKGVQSSLWERLLQPLTAALICHIRGPFIILLAQKKQCWLFKGTIIAACFHAQVESLWKSYNIVQNPCEKWKHPLLFMSISSPRKLSVSFPPKKVKQGEINNCLYQRQNILCFKVVCHVFPKCFIKDCCPMFCNDVKDCFWMFGTSFWIAFMVPTKITIFRITFQESVLNKFFIKSCSLWK